MLGGCQKWTEKYFKNAGRDLVANPKIDRMGEGKNTAARDPLDRIIEMGYRVVWMEDFERRVVVVDDYDIALIDHAVPRRAAARSLRRLLGLPCLCCESPQAS